MKFLEQRFCPTIGLHNDDKTATLALLNQRIPALPRMSTPQPLRGVLCTGLTSEIRQV